jgi:hypothetical protein
MFARGKLISATRQKSRAAAGEYENARQILQAMSTNGTSEQIKKQFYGLFDNYLNETLLATDTILVDSLAQLCPEIYGLVIYQYETLSNLLHQNANTMVTHCDLPVEAFSTQRHATSTTNISKKTNIKIKFSLQPNPNNGTFTIKAENCLAENCSYQLFNSICLLVSEGKLSFSNNIADLSFNLSNGLYTIKLLGNNFVKTQKMVFVK